MIPLRRFFLPGILSSLSFFLVGQLNAQSVTYNFEQFGVGGQTTPLLNVAPEVGSSAFRANFTSAPNAAGFAVSGFPANGLFSGNSLVQFAGTGAQTLTVTLNTAVYAVNLAFGTNGASTLTFVSSAGIVMVASTPQAGGANFPGGILTFTSGVAFTSFTLSTGGVEFAIDNLTMRTEAPGGPGVPEGGSTLVMLALASVAVVGAARYRRSIA